MMRQSILLLLVVALASARRHRPHDSARHRHDDLLRFDCSAAPSSPQDRRVDKTTLRIAHWNVEWLFLTKYEKRWGTLAEAEKHLMDVAEILKRMDADVIHLAEVEDCGVLEKLVAAIGDPTYKYYMVKGTDTATGQNVALLTRVDPIVDLWRTSNRVDFPVPGSECDSSLTGNYGVSKHLFTTIEPEGFGKVFIAGTHLLAIPDDHVRCVKREAQASVLQGVLQEYMSNATNMSFVVMGDLNDWDGQVRDVADSKPISRTLAILKELVEALEGDELFNIAERIVQTDRYTNYWNPEKNVCLKAADSSTSIDHILVDTQLLSNAKLVKFDTSLFSPPCASSGTYSDHWPLVIELVK